MSDRMIGRVHSIQSLGTVDGPGVRFVVFLCGCNLRCSCCHNPDTWDISGGNEFTAEAIVEKAERCKEYFGEEGGITLSGGEPLLQAEFAYEIFKRCREKGINTCLDTSGSIYNDSVDKLLSVTDRVLLDIKYTNDSQYKSYVGCEIEKPLYFLGKLNEKNIKTTVRQVVIPTLNDTEENISALKEIARRYSNIDNIELLPFRKICQVKYDEMGTQFPFADIPEPTEEKMAELNEYLRT